MIKKKVNTYLWVFKMPSWAAGYLAFRNLHTMIQLGYHAEISISNKVSAQAYMHTY